MQDFVKSITIFLLVIVISVKTNNLFSFELNEPLGQINPSSAGCCEYGGVPLPVGDNRKKPDIIGIGMHKSGTTYLYGLLAQHPNFTTPVKTKELLTLGQWPIGINAFDHYMDSWGVLESEQNKHKVLYEITATYLAVPGAVCRFRTLLPDVKYIVVLRDPVKRAISHYNFAHVMFRDGQRRLPPEPFLHAIEKEITALAKHGCTFNSTGGPSRSWNYCFKCWYLISKWEAKKEMCEQFGLISAAHETPCRPKVNVNMYVAFGMYAPQIAWWLQMVPKEQFLFINSDDLKSKPDVVANRIAVEMKQEPIFSKELIDSLNILPNSAQPVVNVTDVSFSQGVERLKEFYRYQVQELYSLFDHIGVDFPPFNAWPRQQQY